jgi:hypothetical protein
MLMAEDTGIDTSEIEKRLLRWTLRWRELAGLVFAWLALATSLHASTLSTPAVDAYNVRLGTETFAALYKFTTNTALVETAEAATNMGMQRHFGSKRRDASLQCDQLDHFGAELPFL